MTLDQATQLAQRSLPIKQRKENRILVTSNHAVYVVKPGGDTENVEAICKANGLQLFDVSAGVELIEKEVKEIKTPKNKAKDVE
jgi:hypothetical protein